MVETVSKAFLSYVHEDMEIAEKIQRHIQRNGIGVWRDKDELPGGLDGKQELGTQSAPAHIFFRCTAKIEQKKGSHLLTTNFR